MRNEDQSSDPESRAGYLSSLQLPKRHALAALGCAAVLLVSAVVFAPSAVAASAILALALAWASFVDIERHILPDIITLGLIVLGLGLACFDPSADLFGRAVGSMSGYLLPASIAFVYRRLRHRDGLGLGDAKLISAAGSWLGWPALPFVLVIAASAGLLFVLLRLSFTRTPLEQRIAFGPFLAAAFWVVWLALGSGASSLLPH